MIFFFYLKKFNFKNIKIISCARLSANLILTFNLISKCSNIFEPNQNAYNII